MKTFYIIIFFYYHEIKMFYTNFNLLDTFQNRIYLIFLHTSFIFIKKKSFNNKEEYKILYQKLFDLIFRKIELNMREIGHGDVIVNKNMKQLVKSFYNILLFCEKFTSETDKSIKVFILKYLKTNSVKKTPNITPLINYFKKYQTFCFSLNADSVLKGELNFNYSK
jgi:hypothetical protein